MRLCTQRCKSCKASKQHQQYEVPQCESLHRSRTVATVSISLTQPVQNPSTLQHQRQDCAAIKTWSTRESELTESVSLSDSAEYSTFQTHESQQDCEIGLFSTELLKNSLVLVHLTIIGELEAGIRSCSPNGHANEGCFPPYRCMATSLFQKKSSRQTSPRTIQCSTGCFDVYHYITPAASLPSQSMRRDTGAAMVLFCLPV